MLFDLQQMYLFVVSDGRRAVMDHKLHVLAWKKMFRVHPFLKGNAQSKQHVFKLCEAFSSMST